MTAEQLKRSILNMAFSGKLVDQRNNEESPVGILHHLTSNNSKNKRIIQIVRKQDGLHYSSEKNRMVCVEEDLLFDIPSTWEWTSLKNVSFVLYGFPFDSAKFNDVEDGTPLIRIRDVLPGFTKTYTTEKCSDEYVIENGDMLVGMDGNFNVNFWNGGTAYLNQRVCRIKAREEILDQKYLSYYLPLEFDRISRNVSYVTVRHLSDKHLSSLFIPIPPLAEQKRIVAKIEELMPFVEQYAAASTKLNTLNASFPEMMKKSILQEAVQGKLVPQDPNDGPASLLLKKIAEEKKRLIKEGKIKKGKYDYYIEHRKEGSFCVTHKGMTLIDEMIFDLPDNWTFCTLSELVQFIGGYAYKSNLFVKDSPYQVLRLGNVKNDLLKLDVNPVYITENLAKETQEFLVRHNDILLTMTGTRLKRDYFYTVCVDDSDNSLFVNQRVGCLRPYFGEMSKWLSYVLKSNYVLDFIFNYETGTANQGNLGAENIMKIIIPLPPINEQKRIVKMLDELTAINKDLLIGPLCE